MANNNNKATSAINLLSNLFPYDSELEKIAKDKANAYLDKTKKNYQAIRESMPDNIKNNPVTKLQNSVYNRSYDLVDRVINPKKIVDDTKAVGNVVKDKVTEYKKDPSKIVNDVKSIPEKTVNYLTDPNPDKDVLIPLDIGLSAAGVVEAPNLIKGISGTAKNTPKTKSVNQAQITEQIKPNTTPNTSMGGDNITIKPNVSNMRNSKTRSEVVNNRAKKQIPESYGKSIDDVITDTTKVKEPVTMDDFYNSKSVVPENDYQINTSIPKSTGELLPESTQRYLTTKAQKAQGAEYNRYVDNFIKQGEKKFGKERFNEILNNDWLFKNEPELYQRFSEPTLLNLGALQEQMSPFRFNQLRNDRLVLQPDLKATEGYQGYTGHTTPNNSNYLKQFKPNLDITDLDNEIIVVNKSQTPTERIATNRHELGHLAASGNNPESSEFLRFKQRHNYPDVYNESFAYGVGDVNTNKVPSQKIINNYYREANYDPQLNPQDVLKHRGLFEDDIRRYANMNKLGLTQDPAAIAQYESMMKQLDPAFTSAFKSKEYYTPFSFDQIRAGEHLFPQQLNTDPRFLYYDK